MRGTHATESQSMRLEYFMRKTIGPLHCQQMNTQYLRAKKLAESEELILSLNP